MRNPRTKLDLPDNIKFSLDVPELSGYHLEDDHPFYQIVTPHGNLAARYCPQCNRIRLAGEFYLKKKTCRQCHMIRVRAWQKKNVDKVRKYRENYKQRQMLLATQVGDV